MGCVAVSSDGSFTFLPAPDGTWFKGEGSGSATEWDSMLNAHCGSLTTRFTNVAFHDDFHIETKKGKP